MKISLILTIALAFSQPARAYESTSPDPQNGFYENETKTAIKVSGATGYDDAISKGHAVFYEDGSGGLTGLYKVSRNYSGTYNTAAASIVSACIATRDVATGELGGFPCVTKGYVDYALYSATAAPGAPIAVGDYLCISDLATSLGRLVKCGSGITSPFIALEAKSTTASGTIKISVQSK